MTAEHPSPLATRLSQSALWQMQRDFYAGTGLGAWDGGGVPYYITNTRHLARTFATIAHGFLRDCASVGPSAGAQFPPLDPSEPVYVLELGAGAGQFGYLASRMLRRRLAESGLGHLPLVYVLTDAASAVLDELEQHEMHRDAAARGEIDFAVFDIGTPGDIVLRGSGRTLGPGSVANPVLAVANYTLDSVPQDRFVVGGGRLFESLVSIDFGDDADPGSGRSLEGATLSFAERPAGPNYYGDVEIDSILYAYSGLEDVTLVFPIAAIECMRWLGSLSHDRLLLVSSDMALNHTDDFDTVGAVDIAHHGGAVSLPVNNHALAQFALGRVGRALHSFHDAGFLDTSVFLLGHHPSQFSETALAFADAIEHGGPDDVHILAKSLRDPEGKFTLKGLLGYFRLCDWEPRVFAEHFGELLDMLPQASVAELREVVHGLEILADSQYPVSGADVDVAFMSGLILYGLGLHQDALGCFRRSIELHGASAETAHNVASCLRALGDEDGAAHWAREAASIDPGFDPANSPTPGTA